MFEAVAFIKRLALITLALSVLPLAWADDARQSKVLESIKKAGVVKIGIKTDVAPFAYINPAGEIVGYEVDLAEDIARRLDVKLLKVGVTTENRFQKLELGDVDLIMATIGDTPARRQIAAGVEPGYYETGVTVLLRPDQAATRYDEIRGQTLCALQGAYFNRPMNDRHLFDLQIYRTVRDAQLALKDGRCIGFLYSTPAVRDYLKRPEWKGYRAPLGNSLATPWAIYLQRDEQGSAFDRFLGDVVADWHRSGTLLSVANKWAVGDDGWLARQKELWSQKNSGGRYVCERTDKGAWPQDCRNTEILTSGDVSGLQALGLWAREKTGVDLNFIYDPFSRTQIVNGVMYSMLLCGLSILLSLSLGILMSIAYDASTPVIQRLLFAVMNWVRLTPPLLLMYLLFFGVGSWLLANYGLRVSAISVAVVCLGFYSAGLVMSALVEATDHVRVAEPGFQLKFSTLLQTLDYASWPIKQAQINLTKQAMVASAIAVPELLSSVSTVMAEKGNIFATITFLLILYYVITTFWTWLFTLLEAKCLAYKVANHA